MNEKNNNLDIKKSNLFNDNFQLFKGGDVLYLKSLIHKDWLPFSISFLSNDIIRRKNQIGLKQEIAKAIGIKNDYKPCILDTTAGLGRDSFLLASLGCQITMLERNPVIYSLLQNAIDNGKKNLEIAEILNRMNLINQDSISYLKDLKDNLFDVIYIDPMFPKSKKSRLVKKDMQVFREIVGDDLDSLELLNLALKQKVKRIVVKRMINSEYLNNLKPQFEIKGKTTRFDVY